MQFAKLSNSQLLFAIQQREIEALSELYDRHATMVFGILVKVIGHDARADQILEDIFAALWDDPYSVNGSIRPWLLRQACAQCVCAGIEMSQVRTSLIPQPFFA